MRYMKVALVYDRVNKWGGAERVLLSLHKIFPKAPLYTSVYNPQSATWAKVFRVCSTFLQKFPFALTHHQWYAPLMPIAFESFNFDAYDVVISVTSEAAKGILTKPTTKHICICLTPTRYLWSGYTEYFSNHLLKFVTKFIVSLLRKWDFAASRRPDEYIAISKEVQRRIKKYYKKPSQVIYPPIQLEKKRLPQKVHNDYFLVVSRLIPYKRIDIAIKACNSLGVPLKIVGIGSEEKYLRSIAGPTIEFIGSLTDEKLIGYYNDCCALLFPGTEDLGLTILEAQAHGKPVVAYKAGGALETIIEGKTGEFFAPQTSRALLKKLQFLLERRKINIGQQKKSRYYQACLKQARTFNQATFKKELLLFLKNAIKT